MSIDESMVVIVVVGHIHKVSSFGGMMCPAPTQYKHSRKMGKFRCGREFIGEEDANEQQNRRTIQIHM